MLKHQNTKKLAIKFLLGLLMVSSLLALPVYAAEPPGCPGGPAGPPSPGTVCADGSMPGGPAQSRCQAGTTPDSKGQCQINTECNNPDNLKDQCQITDYLIKFIDALSAIVGIVIVIMIAIAGIQYSAARDNPQAVVAARAKIFNTILALVVFLFSFAFLQYIVPGGIFS